MFTKDKYALVRSDTLETGYDVVNINDRGWTLFDDMAEAKAVIEKLLNDEAEVFENRNAFNEKYPPLGLEEMLRRGKEQAEILLRDRKH